MEAFLQYLPYILGFAIAVLILVCLFDGSSTSTRKRVEPWRPKQKYYHREDPSPHRLGSNRTPTSPA